MTPPSSRRPAGNAGWHPNAWLRHGALGGAALGAAILLAVFYAVVSGAVERAASRRADALDRASAAAASTTPGSRPVEVARLGS